MDVLAWMCQPQPLMDMATINIRTAMQELKNRMNNDESMVQNLMSDGVQIVLLVSVSDSSYIICMYMYVCVCVCMCVCMYV